MADDFAQDDPTPFTYWQFARLVAGLIAACAVVSALSIVTDPHALKGARMLFGF